jgi:hypothetical protein
MRMATGYSTDRESRNTMLICCIWCGPSEKRIMDIVPGGNELKLQLRRGVGQAAHTHNNPHVKRNGVY